MRDTLFISLKNLKLLRSWKKRTLALLLALSLLVTLDVFWVLRQPGLTLAGDADCGIQEHAHTDECKVQTCICGLPEEGHTHSEECYATIFAEAQEIKRQICEATQEPHNHGESCYTVTEESGESVLTCDIEFDPHTHTEGCFETEVIPASETTELICGLNEGPHEHTDTCYEWEIICELEEHDHQITCYSDEHADVETQLDWQKMFADYPFTEKLGEDLVGIAKTQVGYAESRMNFQLGQDGIRRGYTRYGAWYGAPYSDWSAMFVAFCLHYAGADQGEYPANIGADSMQELWTKLEKYKPAGEYTPVPGDLVFFEHNAVGIVSEVMESTFCVIRGDLEDAVRSEVMLLSDETIEGWGITEVPEPEETVPETTAPVTQPTEPEPTVPETTAPVTQPTEPEPTVPETTAPVTQPTEPEPTVPETTTPVTQPTEPEPTVPETTAPVTQPTEPEPTVPETTAPATQPTEPQATVPVQPVQQTPAAQMTASSQQQTDNPDLLDISNGPAFYIFADRQVKARRQLFALWNARKVNDLLAYLEDNNGSYFFTLLDLNNTELPKDDEGNYIAEANKGYKMAITFQSPEGFLPGTYEYQVPNGLMVDGGEGIFKLTDGTVVGSWTVTDTGLITLVFNEEMNNHADITISATLGLHFPEQNDPIDFDGLITVKVEPPAQQAKPTLLEKWGAGDMAAGKIRWTIRIDGQADSMIPGNILTDRSDASAWAKPHSYTESDMAAGVNFGVSDPNGDWHNWTVYPGDPHLIWDENSWSYKIPQTVTCDYCGELELGNEGWSYLVNYTTTPTDLNMPGTFDYENKVTIDGQTDWGWANFTHGSATAEIIKNGSFVSDAGGGGFLWEVQATIPGRANNERADYSWFFMDEMKLLNAEGIAVGHVQNDVQLSTVTTVYNDKLIQIPNIRDATPQDMFAWDNSWTGSDDGVEHTRTMNILSRCQCTPETCHWGNCSEYWFDRGDGVWITNGFCDCWTETQNMTFTFVYKTRDTDLIQSYGALGYQLNNQAQLYHIPNGTSIRVSADDAKVAIPNLFEKQLTHDFDGYIAHYRVTVNEAKVSLTNGTPLYIRDTMTKTLAYISGSLVITAEDANGNITTLTQGRDYSVTYDGTGSHTDAAGNTVHVLDIVINHPQPVMYILDYDTTLIMPEQVTGAIKYTNSATITLWGEDIKDTTQEKVYADINISTKSYKVKVYKTCAQTMEPLPGAVFGLYNENGGLIVSDVTNASGELTFQTYVNMGIILRDHVLYYIQEQKSPPGYQLDKTKHWFCFCDNGTNCPECREILAGVEGASIIYNQFGKIDITNEIMNYDLPGTGGPGIYPLILVSAMFTVTPLVYWFFRRRKQERRGVE